ncbi:MAG TPA: F0F1 ATP synthase subunit gamma [Candidatus Saccharibacteria bacterium]|mgnify:CR=1 FL=1|jgi:ATP synthase F1 gamma subunit|nr:F0F1 ATP synthase subunit gamma [Candidatus Saccharibacteria bacterium]HMT56066.1 F0F1 ATP synthase subunit gamma [Candidatus Saccharibacteria bacterium]
MRRPNDIERDVKSIGTLVELTSVFEGIASMRIAQIKNQVLQATEFFNDLWEIYSQLRVDNLFRFGRSQSDDEVLNKDLFIIITAEGGFSGDIDQKLIKVMLDDYDKEKHDILVIGHHGAMQLAQRGVKFIKYFKMPTKDKNINVDPIIRYVQKYQKTKVYYQEYISLMVQDVKRIELSAAVQEQGKISEEGEKHEIITSDNTIFEPSMYKVIDHLERSMLQIAMSQLILDSKLAQYASRFRAMTASHERAEESQFDYRLEYNRSKRAIKDQRLKEIINGLRKAKVEA